VSDSGRHAVRGWRTALSAAAGIALIGAVALSIVTAAVTRMLIVPPRRRKDDTPVLAVDRREGTVTLGRNPDSAVPGVYGFEFSGDEGYARLGAVVEATDGRVTRRLTGEDAGRLAPGVHGQVGGTYYRHPEELGLEFGEVAIETELGKAPAWFFPAASDHWVVQVHGRAVTRLEPLRAVPVFHDAGYNCLLVSYRNDPDGPRSADNRYALGDREWRDVEAAIRHCLAMGARRILLMGWSMGGATVLQAVSRSELAAGAVSGLLLDSPVVDWMSALRYQGELMGLPRLIQSSVLVALGARWARAVTGQSQPIDLKRLDVVSSAARLRIPILLFHSDDDGTIPVDASAALAAARPDLVTFERFRTARHTMLWNYDPERWEGAVASWLAERDLLPDLPLGPGQEGAHPADP